MEQEIWKDIMGYEGLYQVSSLGRVKSLERIVEYKDNRKSRIFQSCILSPVINNKGYCTVTLCKNHIKYRWLVHRLVCLTFIPNPLCKCDVNHKDSNPLNNALSNLEWSTRLENIAHAIEFGNLDKKGSLHHNARLTKEQVLSIRQDGGPQKEIAKKYGINQSHVSDIVNRKKWSHV